MTLISKKDLLSITGISYGQLYRWKRENLIPEEWFIKQSSYTGQETFFPREQVLSRVHSILEAKDKYSLEELARIFSPETSETAYSLGIINEIEEIDGALVPYILEAYESAGLEFFDIAFLAALSGFFAANETDEATLEAVIHRAASLSPPKTSINKQCVIFTVDGAAHFALVQTPFAIEFDTDIEVLGSFSIAEAAGRLKMKYNNLDLGKE